MANWWRTGVDAQPPDRSRCKSQIEIGMSKKPCKIGRSVTLTTRVSSVLLAMTWCSFSHAETARSSDSFVDTIGVATHYNYNDTAYANVSQVAAKLHELGVRHIRDGSDRAYVWNDWQQLHDQYGINVTANFTPASFWTMTDMVNLLKAHPRIVDAAEGPNEPDVAGLTYTTGGRTYTGYNGTIKFQNDLYAAVKNAPTISSIPVLSPSMAYPADYAKIAPLSSFDLETMHSYPGGQEPAHDLDRVDIPFTNQIVGPGNLPKPIIATETGYHTALDSIGLTQPGVSETAQAKYMPRLFAEYFNRGIVRTFSYELLDEGRDQNNAEKTFGLLYSDFTPKPAFTAIKNTISLLSDPGPAFTPGELGYTLTGAGEDIHHMLLQKRNGNFYLGLWREVSSFSTADKQDIVNSPEAVTLDLNAPMASAVTYLPTESAGPIDTYSDIQSLHVNVPDQLLLIKLTPLPEPGTGLLIVFALGALHRQRRLSIL